MSILSSLRLRPSLYSFSHLYSISHLTPSRRHFHSTAPTSRSASPVTLSDRERLDYDVLIIGAGPAGLSAAIRLRQLCEASDLDLSVCVLEKGPEVGSHILSGNVFDPRAMRELLPNWYDILSDDINITAATADNFYYLTKTAAYRMPTPPQMSNHGNFVVSLSQITRWLAEQAEAVGVEIYPGFSASQPVVEDGVVTGVLTNDVGLKKDGSPGEAFEPGMYLHAGVTLLAEGARGSVTKDVVERYGLRKHAQHQTYALGIKEVWEVPEDVHEAGRVDHSIGYPLDSRTYGGSFLYHMAENKVSIGFVTALDYRNPYLSPYQEFQRFKAHPSIRKVLQRGTVLQYGARTLNEGGLQSVPQLEFPGGGILGCAAGFLNVPKIKGTHTAQKSGMLAAEAVFDNFKKGEKSAEGYESRLKQSWVWEELSRERNIRPGFKYGLVPGLLNAALETYVTRGKSPWTLKHAEPDHLSTEKSSKHRPIDYPPPDGQVTFDILTSVALSGTNHEEDEPCHLRLKEEGVMHETNLKTFAAPEARYCPAKVYEYVENEQGEEKLQINSQNCLHCKACDIKDPTQNITWTTPQGGGGPKYSMT